MMTIYLNQSQVEVWWLVLIAIGFCVGFLSGLLGVGGGWLITPALNIINIPMTFAIGTGLAQMTGTSLLAASKHRKSGNIDFKLGLAIGLPMVGGVQVGKTWLMQLEAAGQAASVTRIMYMILLGVLGFFMLRESWGALKGKGKGSVANPPLLSRLPAQRLGPATRIPSTGTDIPWVVLIALGVVGGILSGMLGVGGGFMLMPAMVYLLGVPTLRAVATSLVCVLIASIYGTIVFSLSGRVDFMAVAILLLGSFTGTLLGVKATRRINADGLRFLFALLVVIAAISVGLKQYGHDILSMILIFSAAGGLTFGAVGYLLFKKEKSPGAATGV